MKNRQNTTGARPARETRDTGKERKEAAHRRALECMRQLLECRNRRHARSISIVGLAALLATGVAMLFEEPAVMAAWVAIALAAVGALLSSNARNDYEEEDILREYADETEP